MTDPTGGSDAPGVSAGPTGMPADQRVPRWLRVTSLMLGQSTQNLTLGAVALALPLIRSDIAMTFAQAGALSFATTLTYALGQVPAGLLGDRFGARRVMIVGLVGLNAATTLIALVTSYLGMLVVLVVVGALRALVFPPGLSLITAEFSTGRRATAMSLFMSAGFVSTLVVSLAAPPLIAVAGWRGVFAVFGVVGVLTAAVFALVSRTPDPHVARPRAHRAPRTGLRRLLRHPVVWLAAVVQFTRLAVTISLRFWIPTYLVLDKGFSVAAAAVVVAVGSAISIAATLVGGHLSDRRKQPLRVISTSLVMLTIGLVLITTLDELAAVLVVVAVLFAFVQAYSGSLFEVPLRALGEENANVLNGFGNFWANVGGLVMSLALGIVKDVTGSFDAGWLTLAGLCAVALLATVGLRHTAERSGPGSNRVRAELLSGANNE